ncbi:hypothetical protein V6N11_051484 [Hibiscus sabdariffa]|uniref:Uncharacterized protein n=1 Tax=Hibiscus sabdariffa TaxID=183260 RepID=A0ABR2U7E4_9ROSI
MIPCEKDSMIAEIGLEAIKQAFYELVILPLQRPELFSHENASCSSKMDPPRVLFDFQAPRPFSRTDLMKALVTSRKTGVVANEYSRLSSQLSGQWRQREPDDCQVATA